MAKTKAKKKKKKRPLKRRKRSTQDKGKPVRLSSQVLQFIKKYERLNEDKTKESYDSILRRLFGLPTKKGEKQEKETFWLPLGGKKVFRDRADAAGEAVLLAHKKGLKKTKRVIMLKEWP